MVSHEVSIHDIDASGNLVKVQQNLSIDHLDFRRFCLGELVAQDSPHDLIGGGSRE
jgi:hypothetical protein